MARVLRGTGSLMMAYAAQYVFSALYDSPQRALDCAALTNLSSDPTSLDCSALFSAF